MPKSEKKPWYQHLEAEIRDLVRLLRDNGFNTICSCGHEMTIDLVLGNHLDEVEHLANFLVEKGYMGFKINVELYVPRDGYWNRQASIAFQND